MRETLVIFRKDVKRLWPLGAAVSALLVAHGWLDLRLEYSYLLTLNTRLHQYEPLLLFIAWWCLAGVLVQQERAIGGRQYWITRPIAPQSLIAAKALFFVTFICLPSLLCQAAVLATTGFPLAHYLAALVWNQVFIVSYFLVAAAFAAVTRNFRFYALSSLAIFAAFFFVSGWAVNLEGGQWEGVQWTQEAASQIVVLAAAVAALALQYIARRTALARAILGAGVALVALLLWTDWWHTAFTVTAAVAGHPHAASRQVSLAFDAAAPPSLPAPPFPGRVPARDVPAGYPVSEVRVALPIRIGGVPPDRELSTERVSVDIEAPGGVRWSSGWRVRSLVSSHPAWRNMDEWLDKDGLYWLSFNMPLEAFERVANAPARVHAAIAFAEFTGPAVTDLPPRPRQFPVRDVGHCDLDTVNGVLTTVSCVMPFQNYMAVDFRVHPHNGSSDWAASGCCEISYVPFQTGGRFSVWGDVGSLNTGRHMLSPGDRVSIEARRPVGFFERAIEIGNIVLARYETNPRETP